MFRYDRPQRPRRRWGRWVFLFFVLLLLSGLFGGYRWYDANTMAADVTSQATQLFTVDAGTSEDSISRQLEQKGIIRSAFAYQLYVRVHGSRGKMQAGTYELSPSLSVAQIVDVLSSGRVATSLFTILPAQRLDQIEAAFLEAGYTQADITAALDPSLYKGHPALADKPASASLEGYLYPESFTMSPGTPLELIITQSLDQTAQLFSDEIIQVLKTKHGLSVHEAVIIASIVEREVSDPEDRTKVAQVFLKRYELGIPLGSDPTALYGAVLYGLDPSVSTDTPYNTRLYAGLPPGPINNISADSLKAVAYPADTDYLFFVSGDDGKTYFSSTQAEHEALTTQHCVQLCRSY